MAQCLLAERQQRQLDPRRVVIGGLRQVRPGQVRGSADRGQQVVHQGQVQHLLGRHVRDLLAPSGHRRELPLRQSLLGGLLERERREQVLAHDAVLQLGGLAQHVDQRLAVLDHEGCLRGGLATPGGEDLCEPALPGRLHWPVWRGVSVGHDALSAVLVGTISAG